MQAEADRSTPEQQSPEAKPDAPEQAQKTARGPVNKGGLLVLVLIVASLAWYLLADRFTPYTSQARVEGYVTGIAPKVAGLVTQVWAQNNTQVIDGEPLFEIDPSSYQIALNKARSDLEQARSQVGAGDAGVDSARANLRAAQANEKKAQQDLARLERLHKQDPGTISVRRLEVSRATLSQAKAQVAASESEIQRAIEQKGGEDDANNAILKSAESAVAKAELDLGNTLVRAPTSGVITDLRTDVGQYAGTGSPVMTLVAINDLWINAEFTENNLGHMTNNTPVGIVFDALPGRVFEGRVRTIGLGVSAGRTPQPGTLPTVDNNRDWLRQAQRFPVIVEFDPIGDQALHDQIRIGGQAAVIAYSEDSPFLLDWLGRLYLRLMSWLSYAY